MEAILTKISADLDLRKTIRDAETKRLQELQNRDQSIPGVANPSAAMKNFEYKLTTLVGSIQQVSGNRLLKESPRELETLQEINANIQALNQTVKTQGM
jgi:hypothetical protein